MGCPSSSLISRLMDLRSLEFRMCSIISFSWGSMMVSVCGLLDAESMLKFLVLLWMCW